jgi:MoaA/NifB/PqqE/SkfB family radical SAM enzyme
MGHVYLLTISGGEPFLRKDLDEIIFTYHNNNGVISTRIPTNGLLTESIINTTEKILKSCEKMKLSISISLDGIGRQHDKIRGVKGIFDRALNSYNKLKALKSSYSNLNCGILTTYSSLNQDNIEELISFVKNELRPDSFTLLMGRDKPAKYNISDELDINKYVNLVSSTFKESKNTTFSSKIRKGLNIVRSAYIKNVLLNERYLSRCYAGILDCVMTETGTIKPCETLDLEMGNLRDFNYDFYKLWNSKNALSIRKEIKKRKCYCTHECNLQDNILFNPKLAIKVLVKSL